MKPLRDNHTYALLTCMWLGLALTAVLMLNNYRSLSLGVTFVVGIAVAYWMGCTRTKRPWEQWRRKTGDYFERQLKLIERRGKELENSHSITRLDSLSVLAGKEEVLLDALEAIEPHRRVR